MTDDQPTEPNPRGLLTALRTCRLAIDLVAGAARRELIVTVVLSLVGGVLTAAELLVGRRLVSLLVAADRAASNAPSTTTSTTTAGDLVPWLLALAALLIAGSLVTAAVSEIRLLLNELVYQRAVSQLLEAATAAELETFDDPDFHDSIQRARESANQYAWQVVWGMVTLLTTALTVAAVGVVLLTVAPLLVPVALIAYIPIALVSIRNTRALYQLHFGLAELDRDRAYHERLLTGRLEAKEVRAFGLAPWLRARHDALFTERIARTRKVLGRRTALALLGSSVTSAMLVFALAVVAFLTLDNRLRVADAAVAVVAFRQLSSRLASMGNAMTSMFEGVTFLRNFESFRRLVPTRREPVAAATPPRRPSTITVEGLSYHYPAGDTPALSAINLTLRPGQVVAIVGPNGSGKSTLAKLLCGLLPPTSGAIRWDDVNIADAHPEHVRALVAPVFQDYTRYEHTAREAIGFGNLANIDNVDAITTAAHQAGADTFLQSLPNGYDTRLSTAFAGGVDLSVGQWQRLAIARAFLRDAPLVVMDEPAASLDPRAEVDLFERLHELGQNRMVVFISHRFATVKRADHILVLLDGHVAEEGTHDDLMAHRGVYHDLYTLQAAQFG